MKYLYLLAFCLVSYVAQAQKTIDRKDLKGIPYNYQGYHITDSRLDNFVGKWELQEGEQVWLLVLDKVEKYNMKPKFKIDLVVDMVQSRLVSLKRDADGEESQEEQLFFEIGGSESNRSLGFVLRDALSGHMYSGYMKLSKDNPDEAHFEFQQMEKITLVGPDGPLGPQAGGGVRILGGIEAFENVIFRRVKE